MRKSILCFFILFFLINQSISINSISLNGEKEVVIGDSWIYTDSIENATAFKIIKDTNSEDINVSLSRIGDIDSKYLWNDYHTLEGLPFGREVLNGSIDSYDYSYETTIFSKYDINQLISNSSNIITVKLFTNSTNYTNDTYFTQYLMYQFDTFEFLEYSNFTFPSGETVNTIDLVYTRHFNSRIGKTTTIQENFNSTIIFNGTANASEYINGTYSRNIFYDGVQKYKYKFAPGVFRVVHEQRARYLENDTSSLELYEDVNKKMSDFNVANYYDWEPPVISTTEPTSETTSKTTTSLTTSTSETKETPFFIFPVFIALIILTKKVNNIFKYK